jgi:CxxC motif-containing protein (DUF1111 family)
VVFLSPRDDDGGPHPTYGHQFQDLAIPGVRPEGSIRTVRHAVPGRFADGTAYELERLEFRLEEPGYGPIGPARLSPRIGQQIVGVGLLEAIDDATLLALEDPEDRDGDGISGRARRLVDEDGRERIGRFGWKAGQATLEGQVEAALHEDLGITSNARPDEALTSVQRASIDATSGGEPEIDRAKVGRIAHYCRVLAVPRQRNADHPDVVRGSEVFRAIGCAACHRSELLTGSGSPIEAFRGVTIRPYTDLLLHDLGPDLADDRREGDASGREWRTPPLWGVGLVETVNGHTRFLHDGRARNLEEAILWHGGEAEASRERYRSLPANDRAALLAFLGSL